MPQQEQDDHKLSLQIKTKRGTGTRDQDVFKGKVKADSSEELEENVDEMIELIEEKAQSVRGIDPQRGI